MRTISAKFASTCPLCKAKIKKGNPIFHNGQYWICANCQTETHKKETEAEAEARSIQQWIEDSDQAMYDNSRTR